MYETKNMINNLKDLHLPLPIHHESCQHYFSQNLSIVSFVPASGNVVHRFQHNHPFYEFCIPLTPIPFIIIDGVVHLGEVGWVYPFTSNCLHGIKYNVADIAQDNIVVDKAYFEDLLIERGIRHDFTMTPYCASSELRIYLETFKREFMRDELRDELKLRHLTALICDELIDERAVKNPQETQDKSYYQKGIRSAAEYMNDHYEQPILLSDIAQQCGLSRNYFTTCFRQVLGETPLQYLTKLRISKAKQLLVTTDSTLAEICFLCGFMQLNTFTQAFRKTTGYNPSEYRQLQKSHPYSD